MKLKLAIKKVKINYPESLSKSALSFLQSIFIHDASKRASAEQLLTHEFIQSGGSDKVIDGFQENVKKYLN